MDEQAVRARAQTFVDALLAGDIGRASQLVSRELQQNLGTVVAMLPLPLTNAALESVKPTTSGYRAVMRLANNESSMRLETRWKERRRGADYRRSEPSRGAGSDRRGA
ncbi:MAG TPA: hypothetical protein VF136_03650 [Methylomirabilota bacterium]